MTPRKSNAQLWVIYEEIERAAYAGILPASAGQRKGQWLCNELRKLHDFHPILYGTDLPFAADPFNDDANIPAFREYIAEWLPFLDNYDIW